MRESTAVGTHRLPGSSFDQAHPEGMLQPLAPLRLLSSPNSESFQQGTDGRLYDIFGAHEMAVNGVEGIYFALWAPNAEQVAVIGDFDHWNHAASMPTRSDGTSVPIPCSSPYRHWVPFF